MATLRELYLQAGLITRDEHWTQWHRRGLMAPWATGFTNHKSRVLYLRELIERRESGELSSNPDDGPGAGLDLEATKALAKRLVEPMSTKQQHRLYGEVGTGWRHKRQAAQ